MNGVNFSEPEFREALVKGQQKYLHVREDFYVDTKGNKVYTNRSKEVDAIQKRAGCPLGCFWCGAYMYVLFEDMGVNARKDLKVREPLQVKAWFEDPKKIVWRAGQGNQRVGMLPKKGDLVRIFYSHIEMYNGDDWLKDVARKRVLVGGGNTGGGKGAHGVYITDRPISVVQFVANWITPYYLTLK